MKITQIRENGDTEALSVTDIDLLIEKMKKETNCESCMNYFYDDECGYYVCLVNLDEDEMEKFVSSSFYNCPYYQLYDEYKIAKKQM